MTHASNFNTDYKVTVIQVIWLAQADFLMNVKKEKGMHCLKTTSLPAHVLCFLFAVGNGK